MLLPYATVKPHDPDTCRACGPASPGHYVCMNPQCPGRDENDGAGRPATIQIPRHADDAEFDALPIGQCPIDGTVHKAVFACDHCAEDVPPFCTHPEPAPQPCPDCGAGADQACQRRDGTGPLHFTHSARPAPILDQCDHAHRPGCPIFTGCPCATEDTPPVRPTHPAAAGVGPDVSRLLIPVPAAQMLLAQRGIHWWLVREAANVWTQDTQPALRAEYATVDERGHLVFDDDGHEVRQEIVIELTAPAQG